MTDYEFAQCACVLFAEAPNIEELAPALYRWGAWGEPKLGEGEHGWALCGPGRTFALRSGAFLVVDVVDRPWPDDLETAQRVPAIGSAWRVGAFGAVSTPGALARAGDQPWLWDATAAVKQHRGFVRIRTAHAFASGDDAAGEKTKAGEAGGEKAAEQGAGKGEKPADRRAEQRKKFDPLYELSIVTDLAQDVLGLPGALAFFVPGGEALRSAAQVNEALSRKVGAGAAPFELWTNVRALELAREGTARWLLLDVIGLAQLRLPDLEAIFQEGAEDPATVEALLRGAALRLVSGQPIAPGSTTDDARGRRWKASAARGLAAPTRPVVRWLPEQSARASDELLTKLAQMGTG